MPVGLRFCTKEWSCHEASQAPVANCERAKARIFHLDNPKYFRHPVSDTFNGRDIFAPVAAALSLGVGPKKLGVEVDDYVRLPALRAETSGDGVLSGEDTRLHARSSAGE